MACTGWWGKACLIPPQDGFSEPWVPRCVSCFPTCGSIIMSGLQTAQVPHGQGDSSRSSWDGRKLSEQQVHCQDGLPWHGEPRERAGSFLMQAPSGKAGGKSLWTSPYTLTSGSSLTLKAEGAGATQNVPLLGRGPSVSQTSIFV